MSADESESGQTRRTAGEGQASPRVPCRWSVATVKPGAAVRALPDLSVVCDEHERLKAVLFVTTSDLLSAVARGRRPSWLPDDVDLRLAGPKCRPAVQVREFFAGHRRTFELEMTEEGSDFDRQVWGAIAEIPLGCTTSYGELARYIGRPGAAQAVGAAAGRNPRPVIVPCHRVLARGNALGGFTGGVAIKTALLRKERLLFSQASDAEPERRHLMASSRLKLNPLVLACDQLSLL